MERERVRAIRTTVARMVAACYVIAVAGMAGCADQTAGHASANQSGVTTSPSVGRETESSSAPSLSAGDLCDLLTTAEANQAGMHVIDDGDAVDRPGCSWRKPAPSGYVLSVTYYDDMGIDEIRGATDEPVAVTVGSHKGMRYQTALGGNSDISLKITDSSRVDIVVSGAEHGDRLVKKYAKVIEPRLPGGDG